MKEVVFSLKSDPPVDAPLELEFSLEIDTVQRGTVVNLVAGPKGMGMEEQQVILQITPEGIRRIPHVPEEWFPKGLVNFEALPGGTRRLTLRLLA